MRVPAVVTQLLHSRAVLYVIVALSLLSMLSIRVHHLIAFIVLAAIAYSKTKNMILVLGIPLLIVQLLANFHLLENMEGSMTLEEEEMVQEEPEGNMMEATSEMMDSDNVDDTTAAASAAVTELKEAYSGMTGSWAKETQKYQKSLMSAIHNFAPSVSKVKL